MIIPDFPILSLFTGEEKLISLGHQGATGTWEQDILFITSAP